MNEMVERIASAIKDEAFDPMYQDEAIVYARVAIAAMEVPTKEMIDEGADLIIGLVLEGRERTVARQIWQVMHRALADK